MNGWVHQAEQVSLESIRSFLEGSDEICFKSRSWAECYALGRAASGTTAVRHSARPIADSCAQPAYRMYRERSWSFTIEATICFTYGASIRNSFSGPDAVMRS